MRTLDESAAVSLRRASCRHCGQAIVLAPRVGWIETFPGQTYDRCPAGEFGAHEPDPGSDSARPYWAPRQRAAGVTTPGSGR